VEIELRTEGPARLSLLSDRHQHPAAGVLGGLSGAPSVITLDDGSKPHPKSRSSVSPEQRITLLYAGGGGYGDPKLRDRDAVRADLRDGYITPDAARRDYGLE
jgi:N-methylhydantoinase B